MRPLSFNVNGLTWSDPIVLGHNRQALRHFQLLTSRCPSLLLINVQLFIRAIFKLHTCDKITQDLVPAGAVMFVIGPAEKCTQFVLAYL